MAEMITDSESCWIFTYDSENNLIHVPLNILGLGQKFGYPDNLTAVCCESEADAEQEILNLGLKDPR